MILIRQFFLILFVFAGGIGVSQLPNLVLAYQQRLGGALDETQRLIDGFTAQAQAEGLDYQGLAARHAQSSDSAVRGTADRMTALTERHAELSAAQKAFANAPGMGQKIGLLISGDRDLLRATLSAYQPTLTLDPLFGGIGIAAGWLLHGLTRWLVSRPRARRRSASSFS